MRKYHQLLLFLVSCISVTVLLFYRSENSRLKNVLNAVNFFSRKDVADLRQIDSLVVRSEDYEFMRPLPVWQVIGESFHVYAAYWHRNELVNGGEVVALVAGKNGAVVNFRCSAFYGNQVVQGKFRFQPMPQTLENRDVDTDFATYNFFCHLKSGSKQPDSITFSDLSATDKLKHNVRLRYIKRKEENSSKATQLATICLDLVSYNMSSSFAEDEANLLQFFYHHYVLGVEHFIIYNADALPQQVLKKILPHNSIHLHMLPFNFPFGSTNGGERLRSIVESDCLLRNMNLARHVILLSPDEFFLPNAKFSDEHSVLRSMHHYSTEVTRFEVPSFSVCMDRSNRLLANNTLYDPEFPLTHRIFVYRPHVPTSTALSSSSTAAFSLSHALAHKYTSCMHVGKDGLHNWRNSLRHDFMQNIQDILIDVDKLIRK